MRARALMMLAGVAVMSLGQAACISQEEADARRSWAFDLQGNYQGAESSLVVENESAKHDVLVTLDRSGPFSGELVLLERIHSDELRDALRSRVVLGQGLDELTERFQGGDNYSDDFGRSSSIRVASRSYQAVPSDGYTNASVRIRLSLDISNGEDRLGGTYVVEVWETGTGDRGGSTLRMTEEVKLPVSFVRDGGPVQAPICDECI